MDKLQKLDYLTQIESYLEREEIYELMGELLKEIIIHRPAQPLDFIIEKLKQQPRKTN
jgi:adenylate kinase